MRPEGTKVWRKSGRDARKGVPTGRRTERRTKLQQQIELMMAQHAQVEATA